MNDTSQEMQWISVEDRLPDCNVMVLIHDEALASRDSMFNIKHDVKRSAGVRIGVMYSQEEGLRSEGSNGKCKVTHWMPLPEPPQEKPKYLCVDEYMEETIKQIKRAKANKAAMNGELPSIIVTLVNDE